VPEHPEEAADAEEIQTRRYPHTRHRKATALPESTKSPEAVFRRKSFDLNRWPRSSRAQVRLVSA
jgi:hypothetical protein